MTRGRSETDILSYGQALANIEAFNYLEILLSSNNDDCKIVVANLRKAQKKWMILSHILVWEGSYEKVRHFIQSGVSISYPIWIEEVGHALLTSSGH